MRRLLSLVILLNGFIPCRAQLVNGSFEDAAGPTLSAWSSTCGSLSEKSAPDGGGDFCMRVFSGNTQGCWPGYAVQKLPGISGDRAFLLSGWAYALTSQRVGIYFGKVNNGEITLQQGDTTSSTVWKKLEILSEFHLAEGDTAAVVLWGGLTGGPVQGYGFFDLIELQPITAAPSRSKETSIHIFPNPFNKSAIIQSEEYIDNATLLIFNAYGQIVRSVSGISGHSITLVRNQLPPGLYAVQLMAKDRIVSTQKIIIID